MFLNQHYNTRPIVVIPLLNITADTQKTVLCEDIVTLNAFTLEDVTDRTFMWTQTKGAAVEWLESQAQMSVMFRQPAIKDDKVFLLTVDAGKPYQQKLYVSLNSKPTDVYKGSFSINGASAFTKYNEPTLIYMMPAVSARDTIVINNPERALTFSLPRLHTDVPTNIDIQVRSVVRGVTTIVSNLTVSTNIFDYVQVSGLNLNTFYSVQTEFKAKRSLIVNGTSQPTEHLSGLTEIVATDKDVYSSLQNTPITGVITKTYIPRILQLGPDGLSETLNGFKENIPINAIVTKVYIPTIQTLNSPVDTLTTKYNNTAISASVTRITSGSLSTIG